jgi:hypothetical protein
MKKLVFIIAALSISTVAYAQTHKPPAAEPSALTQVETWTIKQWDAATASWAKEKTKWAGCQHRSADRKLSGRESWSFLYTCMNT